MKIFENQGKPFGKILRIIAIVALLATIAGCATGGGMANRKRGGGGLFAQPVNSQSAPMPESDPTAVNPYAPTAK